jgi:serine/threonine protein kinase
MLGALGLAVVASLALNSLLPRSSEVSLPLDATASCALAVAAGASFGLLLLRRLSGRSWLPFAGARSSAPQVLGSYTLGEKIGEGGMGVVYKARHALLERPTAIKLLHPERVKSEDIRRFEREVQLTSRLSHPNTISIYDFGRSKDGAFYYAMEYLDGLDLQTLVEREGPLAPARVAHVLAQLCGALSEAHGAGLIHRDIKPANIMVCERGGEADVVKVLDFGLTKELGAPKMAVTRSDVQTLLGTPLYLSPEALIAPDTMDGRSDLYAVGAVGYFLLTGTPPFSGNGLFEVCAQHLHAEPVPPSRRRRSPVPPELEALILSCLHKSMDGRPQSARALRERLLPLASLAPTPVSVRCPYLSVCS